MIDIVDVHKYGFKSKIYKFMNLGHNKIVFRPLYQGRAYKTNTTISSDITTNNMWRSTSKKNYSITTSTSSAAS